MHYVYFFRSTSNPGRFYIGAISDMKQRIADHNNGKSPHTSKYLPLELECCLGFPNKQKAYDFEKYLKSHSGRAYAKKRLMINPTG